MLEAVVDARLFSGEALRSALAVPIGPDHRPRTIGPFAVVVHTLPMTVAPGELAPDVDVRPHPHIGLAAVTYMLAGHITHRDSLGSRREVGPDGLNYMVAGRGVVHSERFERLRTLGGHLDFLQILLAMPDGAEESDPMFVHLAAEDVPEDADAGARVRRLAGAGTAIAFPAPIFLHDVRLEPDGRYRPPDEVAERAVYVLTGSVEIDGTPVGPQQTALLAGPATVRAVGPARVLAFGGAPVGPRYMWWNFIHSSRERIEAAKAAWRGGAMTLPTGDTEAFTPAPPDRGRPLHHLNAPDPSGADA